MKSAEEQAWSNIELCLNAAKTHAQQLATVYRAQMRMPELHAANVTSARISTVQTEIQDVRSEMNRIFQQGPMPS